MAEPFNPITPREQAEIDAANASGRQPVVFVHGLWLLAGSWGPWRTIFEAAGYTTLAPGWPHDPDTVEEARAHPEAFAGKGIGATTAHFAEIIGKLERRPAIVGHSFGGMITQKLAGMGLGAATVALASAPYRGVLALPISSLRTAWPALRNPLDRTRPLMLSYPQFRYGFANAVTEDEAKQLYEAFPVPGSVRPLWQAATANLRRGSHARVDTNNPEPGPMRLLCGGRDNTAPWAITKYCYKLQKGNPATTEVTEIAGRGHSLVFDSGWHEVAEIVLRFVADHVPAGQ